MKVAIIGAGFTGLSAAQHLTQAGHSVTLMEASNEVGGLAAGFKKKSWDWSVEKAYHHWFASDTAIQDLVSTLGTEAKLIYKRPLTVSFFNDHFYPLDSVPALLRFPGLGWIDKFRFALASAYLKLAASWQSLEGTTVHEWLPRFYGKHTYALIWEPLLKGKFGPYYKEVTMAWMWARIKARTPSLGTYVGGFRGLLDDWVRYLDKAGVEIRLHSPVDKIVQKGTKLTITSPAGAEVFDAVLCTTAPFLLAKMAPQLPEAYLASLLQLKSLGAVVLLLELKTQLSKEGYYWFNLRKDTGTFPFLILAEHTNFVDPKHFGGSHLVYCGDYVEPADPSLKQTKAQILKKYLPALKKINPDFSPEWVTDSFLFQASYAQPVPFVHHSQNLPAIKTPVPGLYLASMSQVYPWDRGTNFAVSLGKEAARLIMDI